MIFVVKEHDSEKAGLHWDFRLQSQKNKSILLSWVLRKPPPTKIGTKIRAIPVNDHSLSYATFSGTISQGYGKGTVKIWDTGNISWESTENQLIFLLYGKKLTGRYVLIPYQKIFIFYKEH